MGLPVRALSDEELIHYAGIDEDAQLEMARRSVEHRGTYIGEITVLKTEIEDLESQIEDLEGESGAADDMQECIQRVYDLLKGHEELEVGEMAEKIQEALDEMADFVR
jgi:phage shock protein A